jgi:hypothetical protein
MENTVKFIKVIKKIGIILLGLTCFLGEITSAIEQNSGKILLQSIPVTSEAIKLKENRVFIRRPILEGMGAKIEWISSQEEKGNGCLIIDFPDVLFGEYVKRPTIKVKIINDYKTKCQFQYYYINDIEYYVFLYYPIDSNRFWVSIRGVLEPSFDIKWNREEKTVLIYNEIHLSRVKLLSKSSEVIINYELHKLNSGLIKQNEEIFIPLREFIELMKGKIEYNPTSEYNSPKIIIKLANIDKEIKIYPKIGRAVLTNNDSKEEKEITFTKKMISRNGSYFIGVDDLISILQAEKHTYLDSDVNVYFNFEF